MGSIQKKIIMPTYEGPTTMTSQLKFERKNYLFVQYDGIEPDKCVVFVRQTYDTNFQETKFVFVIM